MSFEDQRKSCSGRGIVDVCLIEQEKDPRYEGPDNASLDHDRALHTF